MTPTTAILGGTLVDTRSGHATADTTVLLSGDRITEVGPAAQVRIPPDAARVDASGAWLIPGLTDMHVHIRTPVLLPVYLAHGVTTIRDLGGNLARGQLLRRDLADGRRVGPRLFLAGPILDGIPPLWPDISILVDTEDRAKAAVRFLTASGVDYVKVYNSVPETSLEAIVRTAHDLGLRVTGHVPRAITMTRAVEIGMDGLEHIRVTGREMLSPDEASRIDFLPVRRRETLLWERFDVASPPFASLVDRLARAGVFLDPTFVVDASPLRTAEESARAEDMSRWPSWIADAVGLGTTVRGVQSADVRRVMDMPDELLTSAREGFGKRQRFVAMCATAGVHIVSGTDHTGLGDDLPGRGLQRELGYLVECGLSALEALRASTLTAAAALGREAELGSIEPGKVADIVVLDRDPLADIANVAAVRTVIHGGRISAPSDLLAAPPAEPASPYAA